MRIVGTVPSIAQGSLANVYRIPCSNSVRVLRCYLNGNDATFSFFARLVSKNCVIRIKLESEFGMTSRDFEISAMWQRHEISLRSDFRLSPLSVFFNVRSPLLQYVDVAICFPQLEEALFATSPIPPDVILPAIMKPNQIGGSTRAADSTWIDLAANGYAVGSRSATAIIVATPIPDNSQIGKNDFYTYVSVWSQASNCNILAGVSGWSGGKFAIWKRDNGADELIASEFVASKMPYFVSLVFDNNKISLLVNGTICAEGNLPEERVFDRLYFGSSYGEKPYALCGHIQRSMLFEVPLLYPRILEIYRDLCPENSHVTYDYMLKYFRYSITGENETFTLNTCLTDQGFSLFVRQLEFALPRIYEQFPPQKHFKEEDVRDWVYALCHHPGGSRVSRESYTKVGRTDLSLYYNQPADDVPSACEKVYRIEFKIWGREGYTSAPSQPLKYMTDGEMAGAFIMIDRRKSSTIGDFEKIVLDNTEFRCISIKEIPIIDTDVRYFVSFHIDDRYRSARLMLNIYLHIPE